MTMLRGAVIGTGYSAAAQLRAWSQIPSVDVVALAGRNPARADARAAEFGVPAAYADYRQMLEAETLDFVDVATPPDTHEEIVQAAAAHGAHVLCQKPAAPDLGAMRRMIDACAAAGVVFAVNENCRFQPWYRAIRDRIEGGSLGDVTAATFTTRARLSLPAPQFAMQPYFVEMPRLILFELGVHFLDTARYLMGPATSVYALTRRVSPHVVGDDYALAVLTHGTATVTVDLSWAHLPTAAPGPGWAEVRIHGTEASLSLGRDGTLRVVTDQGDQLESFAAIDSVHAGYVAAQSDFASSIQQGVAPETSGLDQLDTLELVFGAYESARSGAVYHVGRDIGLLA